MIPTASMSDNSPSSHEPRRKPIGVPRRFAVGTALIMVTMYSVLFALMTVLGASPIVFGVVVGFFTLVGAAQMLLFGGRRPRDASLVTGAVVFAILPPSSLLGLMLFDTPSLGMGRSLAPILSLTAYMAAIGAVAGYATGCLTAGVFLILNRIDRLLHGPGVDSDQPDPVVPARPSRYERLLDWIGGRLAVIRPYYRGRPFGDAARLFLIVFVMIGLAAPFRVCWWPWWIHLSGSAAVALLLGMIYAGVRLCGFRNALLLGTLSGAAALGPYAPLRRLFFFPHQPIGHIIPAGCVVVLGVVVGYVVLAAVVALQRLCVRERPPCSRASLAVVGVAVVLLAAIHTGAWLTLSRLSDSPRQRALATVHRLGGHVLEDRRVSATRIILRIPGRACDADLEQIAALPRLAYLDLGRSQISDAGLVHFRGLGLLEHLNLSGTQVSGDGLRHLTCSSLDLSNTPVTDEGLVHLKRMGKLVALDLSNTQITDAALEHIKGIPSLKRLKLRHTRVSHEAVVELDNATGGRINLVLP